MKKVVVLSDLQVPYEDKNAVDLVFYFIKYFKPDECWIVGDWIDAPEPSRWNRGTAGEYEKTLQKSIDLSVDYLVKLRNLMGRKPIHFKTGNHDIRAEVYVRRYAPALTSIKALQLEDMLKIDRLNIHMHRSPVELLPNWMLAHGDEGALNRVGGSTAMNLAKRFNKSVVCGHTHRLGIQSTTTSVNGKVTGQLYGFEVGNLMRLNNAHYLPGGSGNWQQGFGILYERNKVVQPVPVYMTPKGFNVEGHWYE